MMLARVLHAESLKMKRTIALKMVIIAPLAVALMVFFVSSQAPFSFIRRNADTWMALLRANLLLWAVLMLPLFITLEAALVAGLDHTDNQWKNLFARPVPRWTWYVAKLLVATAMILGATAALLVAVIASGKLLPFIQPELQFPTPMPLAAMVRQTAQVAGLGFLSLTLQHWVSLRWKSFSIATGVGIVAMVASYLMIVISRQGGWMQYFPWSLPMLPLATPARNTIEASLWTSGVIGLAVATAGCVEFCRREVK
jgi:hypothetical protein